MDIHDYMRSCETKPFQWGQFDCCLFAAGAIEARTGIDCMKHTRNYDDEMTAAIQLRDSFGTAIVRDVFLQIAERYNAKQIDLSEAEDGDIVCVQWPYLFQKANSLDQSCGMAVFYRNQVLACTVRGLISVPPSHRIIDVWSFT